MGTHGRGKPHRRSLKPFVILRCAQDLPRLSVRSFASLRMTDGGTAPAGIPSAREHTSFLTSVNAYGGKPYQRHCVAL